MINPDSVGRTFEGADSVTVSQSEIDASVLSSLKLIRQLLHQLFLFEFLYLNTNQF